MRRVKIAGRASFLRVDKPERFQGTGEPRYSANVLFEPGGEAHKKVKGAMLAAAAEKWGENKAEKAVESLTKQNKVAVVDGDAKGYDGYEGMLVVQAHAKANNPPTLVKTINGENVKLDNESQSDIYSGCYVNAIVEFWAQDNQWGKRINATICGLQFAGDGEPFSGGRPAGSDDFDVVEGASTSDFDEDETF